MKREPPSSFKEMRDQLRTIGVDLVFKRSSWFWKAIHYVLIVVTLGTNRAFLTGFITTIGNKIAVPASWADDWDDLVVVLRRMATIEHELIHVEQFIRVGFGSAKLGIVPGAFWYLLFPLPLGFAWGRWKWEREAYLHELKWLESENFPESYLLERIDHIVGHLTGGNYGWTMPFPKYVRGWFMSQMGLLSESAAA